MDIFSVGRLLMGTLLMTQKNGTRGPIHTIVYLQNARQTRSRTHKVSLNDGVLSGVFRQAGDGGGKLKSARFPGT